MLLVVQAEQSVEAETSRRLASIGSDRTRWPAAARDEVLRLEKKQQVIPLPTPCLPPPPPRPSSISVVSVCVKALTAAAGVRVSVALRL